MRIDSKKLVDALEEAGYEPRSYSGRGMFGKNCVGVTTDRYTPEFKVGIDVALALSTTLDTMEELTNFLEELSATGCSQDQMGLGSITYFPGIPWPEHADPAFREWHKEFLCAFEDEIGEVEEEEMPLEEDLYLERFKKGMTPLEAVKKIHEEWAAE